MRPCRHSSSTLNFTWWPLSQTTTSRRMTTPCTATQNLHELWLAAGQLTNEAYVLNYPSQVLALQHTRTKVITRGWLLLPASPLSFTRSHGVAQCHTHSHPLECTAAVCCALACGRRPCPMQTCGKARLLVTVSQHTGSSPHAFWVIDTNAMNQSTLVAAEHSTMSTPSAELLLL